jgi:hypothetical protein
MPRQSFVAAANNFTKGLVTEASPLNFPENAVTETDNCVYTLLGTVERRKGIDYEDSANTIGITPSEARSSYKWNNAGGDGNTQMLVVQTGLLLHFYRSSSATTSSSLSHQFFGTVDLTEFATEGGLELDECQYADGNGRLFVFNPHMDPVFCTLSGGIITATRIIVQVRDFEGVIEAGVADTTRSTSLTNQHNYNLYNQGWVAVATTTNRTEWSFPVGGTLNLIGTVTTSAQAGLNILVGDPCSITAVNLTTGNIITIQGTVTAYGSASISISLVGNAGMCNLISIQSNLSNNTTRDRITTWFTALTNYPSNSDVWWLYKDSTGAFNPTATVNMVTVSSGPAPKGFVILNAFDQQRSSSSGISGVSNITTSTRPRTGCFFQGRAWYAGINGSSSSTDFPYVSWTENIYFSQIAVNNNDFGKCFQINDPTSEDRFDLLPSDGGVIRIQGCGSIFKLYPMQNGVIVFAANGIWFITGSTGIGFTANDYSVSKLAAIRSISHSSIVNVNGYPMFWNEEGIYYVTPSQQGTSTVSPDMSLSAENLTVSNILTLYKTIPLQSKIYVRGDYDPINYIVQWIYRDTTESSIIDRYEFNRVLNYNVATKAFYTWTFSEFDTNKICGINYISSPGGSAAPPPIFKYTVTQNDVNLGFAEQKEGVYSDWATSVPVIYDSFFVTGYAIPSQAITKFQVTYLNIYNQLRPDINLDVAYDFQGVWDFSLSGNSGKRTTTTEFVNLSNAINPVLAENYHVVRRRHKIRGQGYALQYKISSVDNLPFFILGWSGMETKSASV